MRSRPTPDAEREPVLAGAVREAIGPALRFLEDGPDISSLVLGELWRFDELGPDRGALKAYCAVMAIATDAFRGVRATLLIHDLGSVFVLLRRADEMHTLAVVFGLDPGEAHRWLRGGPVSQSELRQLVNRHEPGLAASMRTTYHMLSDEVHGRAQSLAVYENVYGTFAWPPHGPDVDPTRIRASYTTALSVLMSHFGVLRWMIRRWDLLSPGLGPATAAYYDALVEFVLAHQAHGDWHAIAPGQAAAWLGIPGQESQDA